MTPQWVLHNKHNYIMAMVSGMVMMSDVVTSVWLPTFLEVVACGTCSGVPGDSVSPCGHDEVDPFLGMYVTLYLYIRFDCVEFC